MLNNDFRDLVKKYRRYENRQKSKNAFLIFLFLIIAGLFSFWYIKNKKEDIKKQSITRVIVQKSNSYKENSKRKMTKEEFKDEIKKELKEEIKSEITKKTAPPPEAKANKITFKVTTKKNSKEQLLAYHRKHHNYSSAIALANYFYSKKEYQDAIKWAVAASKQNRFKDRPWIIYAKSKLALGQKDKAKKALEIYLKSNNSKSARNLLNSL